MALLLTYSQLREEFAMSTNISNDRLNAAIEEAQDFDIKPALGNAFFYLVLTQYNTSPIPAIYSLLVDGGEYEDCNGNTVSFKGLAKALKYYALARYRKKQPPTEVPF